MLASLLAILLNGFVSTLCMGYFHRHVGPCCCDCNPRKCFVWFCGCTDTEGRAAVLYLKSLAGVPLLNWLWLRARRLARCYIAR